MKTNQIYSAFAILAASLCLHSHALAGEMMGASPAAQAAQEQASPSPFGDLRGALPDSPATTTRNLFIEAQSQYQGDKAWAPSVNSVDMSDMNRVAGANGGAKKASRISITPEEANWRPVQILVSLSKQRMSVFAPGKTMTNIKIATSSDKGDFYAELKHPKGAKEASATAIGCYEPYLLDPNHNSTQHGGAKMGHSTFFFDGEAIHEGNPNANSHGCVHAPPAVATELQKIINENGGKAKTAVCVTK